jgi:predicted permease
MTFIIFSTLVLTVILKTHNEEKVKPNIILKKIFLFPPFIAALTAFILSSCCDYSIINPFLDKILATLSPLALFSIGLQLKFDNIRNEIKNLSVGLIYKLIIAPSIILLIVILIGEKTMLGCITIFQASMPAHIMSSLLASQYGIKSKLCSMFVGVGIIVSLFTSAMWYLILQYIL